MAAATAAAAAMENGFAMSTFWQSRQPQRQAAVCLLWMFALRRRGQRNATQTQTQTQTPLQLAVEANTRLNVVALPICWLPFSALHIEVNRNRIKLHCLIGNCYCCYWLICWSGQGNSMQATAACGSRKSQLASYSPQHTQLHELQSWQVTKCNKN